MSSMNVQRFNKDEVEAKKIYSLTQDENGFLWIGTDYGLRRFDGTRFKQYLHSETDTGSLNDNTVLKVLSANGDLWIATEDGLHLYMPEEDKFRLVQLPGKTNHGYISDVTSDNCEGVWFIVGGVGLFHVNNQDNASQGPFLTDYPVGNVIVDESGDCWLSSIEMTDILRFDPKDNSIKKYGEISNPIICIAENVDNIPIVFTDAGIYIHDRDSDKFTLKHAIDLKESMPLGVPWFQREKHPFLFASTDGVRGMKEDLTLNRICDNSSEGMDFHHIPCTALTMDSQSNLWMGKSDGSIILLKADEEPFKYIDLSHGNDMKIMAATKDVNTDLWVALSNRKLLHIDRECNVISSLQTSGSPSALCCDGDYVYVWETGIGLCSYSRYGNRRTVLYPFTKNNLSTGMLSGESGEIFIAVYGCGLLRYDVETNRSDWFTSKSSELINNWITTLCMDKENNILWIGHSGGLSWMNTDTNHLEVVPDSSSFRTVKCYSIDIDTNNDIWAGTSKGLYAINIDNFGIRKYSKADGLSDETICGVVAYPEGTVWCSTPRGLNRLDTKTGNITSFYGGYGMVDNYFEKNIGIRGNDGSIYFASDGGMTFFNPHIAEYHKLTEDIIITDLTISGKSINCSMKSGNRQIITSPIYLADDINLSFNDNTFTLYLSMDNFYNVNNCQYEYRMNNKEEQWHQLVPEESTLSFYNLPPGDYDLRIRARENRNISPEKQLSIHISNPWYFSTLAKFIYLLLFLGALILITIILRQRHKKEINEAKINYFMNVSHDIRSPLTLLLDPLETLMRQKHDKSSYNMMSVMHHNALRIKNLIDQMLDIKKLEDGRLKLRFTKTEVVRYLQNLLEIFSFQAESHKIKLTFTFDAPEIWAWIDVNNMDKVLVNLIFNAFKFTPDGGEISIHVAHGFSDKMGSPPEEYIKISVADTGKGLEESEIPKIFDRFYQNEKSADKTVNVGYGIGLNLCKMLVELHHGKIYAENRTDKAGCIFTITIPAGNGHLKAEEIESDTIAERRLLTHYIQHNDISENDIKKHRKNGIYKVLIVDDDEEIVDYLHSQLKSKYMILKATNGQKALELAVKNKPDLIISDIIMPGIDGIQLLQRLKSNVETNHIPIIILSTLGTVENRINGLKYGADGYIGKPFDMSEISVMIENLISTRKKLRGKYSGVQEQNGKIKEITISDNEKRLMDKIVQVINDNFSNPEFSIEELSREVGISRAHLHRKMKEYTGISGSDFIRNIRLKKACELLKNQNIDISQIAYAVGFRNVGYFATIFKKYYGITPSDYRANSINEK